MRSLGIVRKIDNLGRVVIPKELRDVMGIEEGTPMEMFSEGEEIIIRKYNPGCHCCGSMNNIKEVMGLKICDDCLNEFVKYRDMIDKLR